MLKDKGRTVRVGHSVVVEDQNPQEVSGNGRQHFE